MKLIYEKIAELIKDKKEFVVATVVNAKSSTPGKIGFKMVVLPDDSFFGTVGGGAIEKDVLDQSKDMFINHKHIFKTYALKKSKENSFGICGGVMQLYMEYVGAKIQFVIFGVGHISKTMYDIVNLTGEYDLLISDIRPKLANKIRFPEAELFIGDKFYNTVTKMPIKNDAIIVIVTAGGEEDPSILKGLLEKKVNYKYIGIIGSINRRNRCFDKAKEMGISEEFLNKICSPVGLAIGADTPFEISISILAEIIAVKSNVISKIKTEKNAHDEATLP